MIFKDFRWSVHVRTHVHTHARAHTHTIYRGDLMMTIVAPDLPGIYIDHGNFIELFCRNDIYDLSRYGLPFVFPSSPPFCGCEVH